MANHNEEAEQIPYNTISADEAQKMIASGAHIIDVRRPEEWERGHIAEATLMPVEAGIYLFGNALQTLNLPQEEPVIFTCASGHRSSLACEIALLTGLHNIYNMQNGMNGWQSRGLPIER
ncbi:MAG TPA: rhodanese-like domain-containing protein [Ktedonobacteraceae bacterium]|jgi:rhodanese-related sulfurtransferase|nr:rhodanese-like domain-containing protein [Ktedonobacteraceae bacterium]